LELLHNFKALSRSPHFLLLLIAGIFQTDILGVIEVCFILNVNNFFTSRYGVQLLQIA